MRSRALLPLAALLAASAWCVVLLAVRKHAYGFSGYPYLTWNLTLAWVPLGFAILLVVAYRRGRPALELLALGAGWLLFLPNAPYVLTDFIHLGAEHRLFDTLILASFAFTSLAAGFASLVLVQLVVTRAAGALIGWAVALVSLFASSVGIYLGRVLRLNSWDVIERPHHVWALTRFRLADPLGNPHLLGYVIGLCGFLMLAYAALYGFTLLVAGARGDRDPLLGS